MSLSLAYHSLPLELLHRKLHQKIALSLFSAPREALKAVVLKNGPPDMRPGDGISWEFLFNVAAEIEGLIATILERRTVFFWQHLYRRLAPTLPPQMGGKVDATTVCLVREIVECAILKYGAFKKRSELALFTELGVRQVFGGYFLESFEKAFPNKRRRYQIFESFRKSPEWVIREFLDRDLTDIYFVEGLAYQYWRLTAKMRAVGKGAKVCLGNDYEIWDEQNEELWALFENYDRRAEKYNVFDGSSLGIWFDYREFNRTGNILSFEPNGRQIDVAPFFASVGLSLESVNSEKVATNYLPGIIDGRSFVEAHAYILEEFKYQKGYSLDGLIVVLETIGKSVLGISSEYLRNVVGAESAFWLSIYSLSNRAYLPKSDGMFASMRSSAISEVSTRLGISEQLACSEVDRILKTLILSEDSREIIGLWSRGPRHPIIPFESGYIFDLSGIHRLLFNVFVGVREKTSERGLIFEDSLRKSIAREGFDLERRQFKFHDGTEREADAVLFIGTTLVVVDCLSVWKPLDFEISRPKTMSTRQGYLADKVAASLGRTQKLFEHRVGKNFDFSRAEKIETIVVTPFVEWIWSSDPTLWIDNLTPRIMRANEFLEWAHAKKNEANTV